jgi:hypothetical protein
MFARMVEKSIMCNWITSEVPVDKSLELGVGIGSHGRFSKEVVTAISLQN